MKVSLIAHTPDPEKVVAAAAKLCYSNARIDDLLAGLTPEKSREFVERLAKLGHESPTEHVSFTFAIEGVSRSLLAQITRHRIASYCISGDTVVGYQEKNKGMTIKELAEKTHQYKAMSKLRSVNEHTKELFYNNVVDAWYSGKKDVYELTTEDGYHIKTTKQHKFLTDSGYVPLSDLHVGDVVFTNGIPAYKNKDWLQLKYKEENMSQEEIGNYCGVSKHTIRSWIRKFNLQKPAGSWSIGKMPPNAGKNKFTYAPLMETSIKMRGNKNCQNRIYVLNENPTTISGGYFFTHRKYKKTGKCTQCGENAYTELHHKDRNPRNTNPENVIELCVTCHKRAHLGAAVMAVKPSKIKSITYVGIEDTYDVEMKSPHNNFVANGFIVHNCVQSQRYVSMDNMEEVVPPVIQEDSELKADYDTFMAECLSVYDGFVKRLTEKYVANGMDEKTAVKTAQEDARFVLPNACDTKMIVTMNARSLQNFFRHRCCNRAQWEIRDLADEMLRLVYPIAPSLFKMSGPGCVSGACPEGTMSCGKAVAMREKYDTLKAEEEAVGQWQEN